MTNNNSTTIYRIILRRNGRLIDTNVYSSLESAVKDAEFCIADYRGNYGGSKYRKLYILEEDNQGYLVNIFNEYGLDCLKSDYYQAITPTVFLKAVNGSGRFTFRTEEAAIKFIPRLVDLSGDHTFVITDYNQTYGNYYNQKGELIEK